MTTKSKLAIGQRVRVTWEDSTMKGTEGVIYWYEPSRPCPWHVRPDGWGDNTPGVAYAEDELEPVGESE